MFKALMVLCKVAMAAPGGEEAAQGCLWKEELWGALLQAYPEVFVSFGGLFCSEPCKDMPVYPLGCPLGSSYGRRWWRELQGSMAAHLGRLVRCFVAFNACVSRDPFHLYCACLYARCSRVLWPCLGSFLKIYER